MSKVVIIKGSVLDILQKRLQPDYVGWYDQYRAILHALGIDPDERYSEFKNKLPKEGK